MFMEIKGLEIYFIDKKTKISDDVKDILDSG